MADAKKIFEIDFCAVYRQGVGFFEAWVSVFDGVLNWNYRLSTLASAGQTEGGTVPNQERGNESTRRIASCFGASMTLCRRAGVQSPGRC